MKELIDAAFSAANLLPTILFGLVVVYWLFVLIGALDINVFDFSVDSGDVDLDMDADAEVDLDAEVETDIESEMAAQGQVEGGVAMSLNSILSFFNLGKVPFMILMSFFTLSLWVISISANYLLANQSFLLSLILLIPNIIVSLFTSKFLTTPFAFVYQKMLKNNADSFKYQGKICTMLMNASDSKIGQGQIEYNGSVIRVNVLTKKGVIIRVGETGLIINRIKEKNCYLIEPYKL